MRQPLAIGKENGGLYLVDHKFCNPSSAGSSNFSSQPSITATTSAFSCQMSSLELWHCRLGYMSFDNMKHIDMISSCKSKPSSVCQVCHHAKQHRDPFPASTSCTSYIFEIIHVDIWGPYAHPTHYGYKYFSAIADDHSRATWTHLLATKSNTLPILKSFIAFIKKQFNTTVKIIRSDNVKNSMTI